jgi:hypothetical protein
MVDAIPNATSVITITGAHAQYVKNTRNQATSPSIAKPATMEKNFFECGDPNHFKNACPKLNNANGNNGNQVCGRAFVKGASEARQDPHVVTCTFLLNNHYPSMLFDTRVDRSFISSNFASLIGLELTKLNDSYNVELADGKLIKVRDIALARALNLYAHLFSIDRMPLKLGSFDLVVGMDWLAKNKVDILCHEKSIRIPL